MPGAAPSTVLRIDADRHTVEPMELWPRELPARWKDEAPSYGWPNRDAFSAALTRRFGCTPPAIEPLPIVLQGGRPLLHGLTADAQVDLALATRKRTAAWWSGNRPDAQLASMDETGFDVAHLIPTWTSYLLAVDSMDPNLVACFARIYNDWLSDYCQYAPARLRPVGVFSRHDPLDALTELERACDRGWTAVVTRPNPIAGRTLAHPDWAPFWRACEERGMAVVLHEGSHARAATVGAERLRSRFAQHACSHPMEQMLAFASLLEGGVLERHPALKIGFLEAGAGWVPFWLQRLDSEFDKLGGEVKGAVNRRPSEYFDRQCWVTLDADEPLSPLLERPGLSRLMFGSDYPHVDHELSGLDRVLMGLDAERARAITQDNARAFYG